MENKKRGVVVGWLNIAAIGICTLIPQFVLASASITSVSIPANPVLPGGEYRIVVNANVNSDLTPNRVTSWACASIRVGGTPQTTGYTFMSNLDAHTSAGTETYPWQFSGPLWAPTTPGTYDIGIRLHNKSDTAGCLNNYDATAPLPSNENVFDYNFPGALVVSQPQPMTFAQQADVIFNSINSFVTLSPATGGTPGLPIIYTSTTQSVCKTINDQSSTILEVATGTCTIVASRAGDPTTLSTTFKILPPQPQVLTFTQQSDFILGTNSNFLQIIGATGGGSVFPIIYTSNTPSVCTVYNSVNRSIQILSAGTCTLTANRQADTQYLAASPVSMSFNVTNVQPQTITFPQQANILIGTNGNILNFTAATGGGSGNPISYSSATTNVCTIGNSSSPTVQLLQSGTCTINANQAGNSSYTAAPQVSMSFQVLPKAAQTISFPQQADVRFGSNNNFVTPTAATGGASGNVILYSSATTNVCTVINSNSSALQLVGPGTCTINVNQAGNASYLDAQQVTMSFQVLPKFTQTITFPQSNDVTYGTNNNLGVAFTAATGGASGMPVLYTSATPLVCNPFNASNASVNILSVGTCTINANQAGAATYDPAPQVSMSFEITKRPITFSATGVNKVYDGNTSGTVPATINFATGVLSTDLPNISVSATTAEFATAEPGTGITVTISGVTISGSASGNYSAPTSFTTTANINKISVDATITVSDKVYDNTSAGTPTGCSILGNPVGLTCTATGATFSDVNVGTNIPVTGGGVILGGPNVGHYQLSSNPVTGTGNITKRPITVSATVDGKTYDGTTNQSDPQARNASITDGTLAQGDTATFSQHFDTPDAGVPGAGDKIVIPTITFNPSNKINNYEVTYVNNVGAISRAVLTPVFVAYPMSINKKYDGTNVANVTFNQLIRLDLQYLIPKDFGNVQANFTTATFGDKHQTVDTSSPSSVVTLNDIYLTGSSASNYRLATTSASNATAGKIFPIQIIPEGIVGVTKEYDGTSNMTADYTNVTLPGVVQGDTVTLDTSNASLQLLNNKAGNQNFRVNNLSLLGSDSSDYYLQNGTYSITITKRPLTITPAGVNKVYDATNNATSTFTYSNIVNSDNVEVGTYTATFDSTDAGTGKTVTLNIESLTGTSSSNYSYTSSYTTTADIAKLPVTVTPDSNQSKLVNANEPVLTYTVNPSLPSSGTSLIGTLSRAVGETFGVYEINQGTLSGGTNYDITFTSGVNFTINQRPQVITFTNPGDKASTVKDFDLVVSSDSDLSVVLVSTTTSICTLTGKTIHVVGVLGQCVVMASQAGNATYLPATDVYVIFNIVQDVVAPVISAQTDISIEATGSNGATVTFTKPTATDDVDGPVEVTCSSDSGTVFPVGITQINCNAKDKAGNDAKTLLFNIEVKDTTPPAITLNGPATVNLIVNAPYTEQGAESSDLVDGDGVATPSGVVDVTTPGTYTVTYTATDSHSNSSTITRTINVTQNVPTSIGTPADTVVEATSPSGAVVTFTDPTVTNGNFGSTYTVTCVDPSGSTFAIGENTVTCTYTDSQNGSNAPSPTTFKITVRDTTPPTINLIGSASMTIKKGEVFTDPGATASDIVDTTDVVVVTGTVDTSTVGTYTLNYDATDTANNVATRVTRTVRVISTPKATASSTSVTAVSDTGTNVTYGVPEITGGEPGEVITAQCTPPSGSNFPIGVTKVTCTFTNSVTGGGVPEPLSFDVEVKKSNNGMVYTSYAPIPSAPVVNVPTPKPIGQVLGASTSTVPVLSTTSRATTTCIVFTQTMKLGNKDGVKGKTEIAKLQKYLKDLGFFSGNATGYFGRVTRVSVQKYQAANNILQSGNVGPITLARINSCK